MNTTPLIVNAGATFTTQGLVVLGVVIGIGVGLLVFYFGWRKLKSVANNGTIDSSSNDYVNGEWLDVMGTGHKTKKERDEMNDTIDKMGW